MAQSLKPCDALQREQPVQVFRYKTPWVWIVSHEVWSRPTSASSLVPDDHPIRTVRYRVDSLFAPHVAALRSVVAERGAAVLLPVELVFRALLLQPMYSVRNEQRLLEQIGYNILFRWFVGLDLHQQSLPKMEFIRALQRLQGHERAIQLVGRIMAELSPSLESDMEFRPDPDLLRAWRARGRSGAI